MNKLISLIKGYPPVIVTNDFGDKIKTYHPNRLIYFYSLKGVDHKNRFLRDIWEWSDTNLEYTHDYIQWIFPLRKYSQYNKSAPILTDKSINIFRNSKSLKDNVFKSYLKMLSFYGFEVAEKNNITIIPSSTFDVKAKKWIRNNNHNFLRISRILESLSLLGLEESAHKFLSALLILDKQYLDRFSVKSIDFWKKAAGS